MNSNSNWCVPIIFERTRVLANKLWCVEETKLLQNNWNKKELIGSLHWQTAKRSHLIANFAHSTICITELKTERKKMLVNIPGEWMTHGVKDEEETNHIHTLSRTHRHHHHHDHHHQHTQCKSTIVRSSNHRIITDYSLINFIAEPTIHNVNR